MCETELDYWSWCAKITEKLTFMRLKVGDRKDIAEDDYELLRVLFPIWYKGEFPLYQTKMEGVPPPVTQSTIFDAISSENSSTTWGGTLLDYGDDESNLNEK